MYYNVIMRVHRAGAKLPHHKSRSRARGGPALNVCVIIMFQCVCCVLLYSMLCASISSVFKVSMRLRACLMIVSFRGTRATTALTCIIRNTHVHTSSSSCACVCVCVCLDKKLCQIVRLPSNRCRFIYSGWCIYYYVHDVYLK